MPTANTFSKAISICNSSSLNTIRHTQNDYSDRCVAQKLGLWSNTNGYNGNRLAKILRKHQMTTEIIIVVNHCNDKYRQKSLDDWAHSAYQCFSAGTIGSWLKEHIKQLHNNDNNDLELIK